MGSDIDTFDDILPEPAVTHARAGGRFQPKAKAQPRRETSASVPSTLPDGIKDKLVTPASNGLEAEQSLQPIVANNVLQDSAVSSFPASEVVGTEEPLKGNEVSFSEDVGLMDALHSDNVISDGNCDSHSNFGKSEDDTMGFDITSFNDILPEPVTAKLGGKFLPKAKPHPRKNQSVPITSVLPNAMKEQPIRQASAGSDEKETVKPVDVADNKLTDPVDPSLTSLRIVVTGKDASSRNALNEEVEVSGSTDYWHSSFEKSDGKVDSMGFNLEPFCDILPEPVASNARAGGKYQPKAKPWPGKGTFAPVSSASPNFTLGKPITPTPTVSNKAQCVESFVADNTLTGVVGLSLTASEILKEPVGNNYLSSGVSFSGDHRSSKLVEPSQLVAVNTLHSEVAASDGSGYWHSSFGKSAGENADIFSGLDCFDDFLTQSTSGTVSAASKPFHKVDMDAQPGNKSLTSCSVDRVRESLSPSEVPNLDALNNKDSELNSSCHAAEDHTCPDYCITQDSVNCGETAVSNNDFQIGNRRLETEFQEGEAFPDLETLDIISEATIASGRRTSKFLPKHKVKEKSSDPRPNAVESTMCFPDAQLAASETEYMNEGSIPAFPPDKVLNKASVGFSDSIPPDHSSELRVNEEMRNAAETSPSNAAISDAVHPEAVAGTSGEVGAKSRKRKTNNVSDLSSKAKKSSSALEENEGGKSSRQRRKRVGAHQLVDEPMDEANDAVGIPAEAPGASDLDEDEHDDEYTLQGSSHQKKRSPRKSKKPVAENEKSARKRKKASEPPDNSTKEAPKKFSHSTRRTKRCVNKVLLNTPEDEIDYRKLPIKDLILFAGFKERMAIKEAKTSKVSLTNQSAANSFHGEASHSEDENLDSAQGRDSADDQPAPMSQLEYSYFNYQSYMDKTPITRWSKQDTELFYEAVRQFGTDFSMIQQLFPGRTRHQVKLKFKKEERQHPLRLAEAVKNRAKDHSHFESVIERLKQAATQEEQDNVEDSIDMTGKEGEEVSQIDEEAAQPKQEREKSERDEEDLERKGEEDVEAGAPADVSHLKSDESEEDEADMWSQYKSEY